VIRFVIVCMIAAFLTGTTLSNAAEPARAVKEVYDSVKTAVRDHNGTLAADLLSAGTVALCERGRILALSHGVVDLESLSQTLVLLIFQLRYYASSQELAAMSGKDVIAWSVSKNLVRKDFICSIALDQVQVENGRAWANFSSYGQPVPDAFLYFQKEAQQWRLDAAALAPSLEDFSAQLRQSLGMTKVEVARYLMLLIYGVVVPSSIVDGPLR